MKYWLIAVSKLDMERILKLGTFGRNSNARVLEVSVGDKLAFYVTKESRIVAVGEVSQGYYLSEKRIFRDDRSTYPHRIDFRAKELQESVDFKPLVTKLSFIKIPAYWPAYIRRGFAEMTEKDWSVICKAAKL